MIELLSPEGVKTLRKYISPATLFAFDLDGTLAPIVDDPTAAALPEATRLILQQLTRLVPTAIITGRSCTDARGRLGFEPRYLVGNHGLEGLPGNDVDLPELHKLIDHWRSELLVLLPPQLVQELYFEHKAGTLSLHYRHASDPAAAHRTLLDAIVQLQPQPRYVGGKFIDNLIPRGAPHKGDALLRLMDDAVAPSALFIGDDETDEDVFRLADPRILSVCVGTERATAARYRIDDQLQVEAVLQEILQMLQQAA